MESFRTGSHYYVEKFFNTRVAVKRDEETSFTALIPAGGWLRGVRMTCVGSGGAGGTFKGGTAAAVIGSASLANTNGSFILFPQRGETTILNSFYQQPWLGANLNRQGYSNSTAAPMFSMLYSTEIVKTAGCLPNQDARDSYQFSFTIAPGNLSYTVPPPGQVYPTLDIVLYSESWASPDKNANCETPPPGICIHPMRRSQLVDLPVSGSQFVAQVANVGNIIRSITLIFRDTAGGRVNATANGLHWRLNDQSLGVYTFAELDNQMSDFYQALAVGQIARYGGTLTFPRFRDPYTDVGTGWLHTHADSYLTFEFTTSAASGDTLEIITDEIVPVGPIPPELMDV